MGIDGLIWFILGMVEGFCIGSIFVMFLLCDTKD